MNGSRIKKTRKTAMNLILAKIGLTVKEKTKIYNETVKIIKRKPLRKWIQTNIPKKIKMISKKIHAKESWQDFKERRKISNKIRRKKEKINA